MVLPFLYAAAAAFATAIRRFFTPSIDSIMADFQKKIDQLDRVIDRAHDEAAAVRDRREALRAQLADTYEESARCEQTAFTASKIRNNLRSIVNA